MTLLDEPSLFEDLDAQLLFKEARQRRRRLRMAGCIVVVVVVAAVVTVGFGLHAIPGPGAAVPPLGSRPPSASGDGARATLVYAYKDLRVINADTGTSHSLPLPAAEGGSSDLSMVRIRHSLVLNRGDTAWLYGPDLHGPPVDLGPSLRVMPGPSADEAWIWSDPCGADAGCPNGGKALQQGDLRLVDTSGNQIGPPIALPADATWFPTGDVVSAGLVLAVASIGPDSEEVWNPLTDHVVRILPGADVLASRGNLVAWTTGKACLPQCAVHFTDVQTGMARTLRLPSEATGTGHGAFSPDGSTFALPVGIGGRPGVHPAAVAVMDLRTQVVRLLPGTEQAPGPSRAPQIAFWSSTGWLFVAEVGSTHVLSWRPGDQGATVLSKVRLPSIALNPPQFQSEYPNLFAA